MSEFKPVPLIWSLKWLLDLYLNPLKTICFCCNTHFPIDPSPSILGTSLQEVKSGHKKREVLCQKLAIFFLTYPFWYILISIYPDKPVALHHI